MRKYYREVYCVTVYTKFREDLLTTLLRDSNVFWLDYWLLYRITNYSMTLAAGTMVAVMLMGTDSWQPVTVHCMQRANSVKPILQVLHLHPYHFLVICTLRLYLRNTRKYKFLPVLLFLFLLYPFFLSSFLFFPSIKIGKITLHIHEAIYFLEVVHVRIIVSNG